MSKEKFKEDAIAYLCKHRSATGCNLLRFGTIEKKVTPDTVQEVYDELIAEELATGDPSKPFVLKGTSKLFADNPKETDPLAAGITLSGDGLLDDNDF